MGRVPWRIALVGGRRRRAGGDRRRPGGRAGLRGGVRNPELSP